MRKKSLRTNTDTDALFEGVDTSGSTRTELENSKRLYTYLLESIDAAIESDRPLDAVVDEGVLTGLIGAGLGATVMPAIMKAVCGALGVERGVLYDLLTSKLVNTAVGGKLGLRL